MAAGSRISNAQGEEEGAEKAQGEGGEE